MSLSPPSSKLQIHETLSPKSSITRSSSTNKPLKPPKIDSNKFSLEIFKYLSPANTNFQKLSYMSGNFSSTTRSHHTLSSKSPELIQKLGMDGNIRKTKGVPLQPFEAFDQLMDYFVRNVKGFCYLWRFDDAAKFLKEHSVSEVGPYLKLLECYCNAGMLDEANDVHELMLKKKFKSICSWTTLIEALCGEDEYDKAFATLKRMIAFWDWDKKHITPDSFASLLDGNMNKVLILAMHTMLVSGLWKEGHEHDATELGKNGNKHVAELPDEC